MGGGSSGSSSQTSQPIWFPGQESYIPQFVGPFQQMLEGGFTSPRAQALLNLATSSAQKGTAQERQRIAGTPGLTAPAKAKLTQEAGDKAITSVAGIPGNLWNMAYQTLSQYALQAPAIGTSGSGSSQGFQICWVWTYFDGDHGEITEYMRKFRDTTFGKGSPVDLGYKAMGRVMKGWLDKSKLFRWIVKVVIFYPLTSYAKGSKNPIYWLDAKFWTMVWTLLGWREKKRGDEGQRLTQVVEGGK